MEKKRGCGERAYHLELKDPDESFSFKNNGH